MPKYYAVRNGRNPGIYNSWDDCKAQTNGYSNAKFKSFDSSEAADQYMNNSVNNHSSSYPTNSVCPNNLSHSRGYSNEYSPSPVPQTRGGTRLDIYTDGACRNNGFGGAKAGIGVHFPNFPQNDISEPLSGRQTNNRAEIKAVTRALQVAKQMDESCVRINTDSQFLHSSVNDWQQKWKNNGWKKSDGSDVINKDDFLELEVASKGMDIEWRKVAAHKGIAGNEEADRLANRGVESHH